MSNQLKRPCQQGIREWSRVTNIESVRQWHKIYTPFYSDQQIEDFVKIYRERLQLLKDIQKPKKAKKKQQKQKQGDQGQEEEEQKIDDIKQFIVMKSEFKRLMQETI